MRLVWTVFVDVSEFILGETTVIPVLFGDKGEAIMGSGIV